MIIVTILDTLSSLLHHEDLCSIPLKLLLSNAPDPMETEKDCYRWA